MLGLTKKSRRRKQMKKVKAGDGHLLKPYRIWNIFTHSLFHLEITNKADRNTTYYALKSRYFSEEPSVDLYKEGRHIAFSKLPAVFPVDDGMIEVKNSTSGINKINYVSNQDAIFTVYPDKNSVRGFRRGFHQRFPVISNFIGILAIIILLFSLVLTVLQLTETLTEIPWVAENIGTFTSPISLSLWENFAVAIIAATAATERAFMLKRHWLIDIEAGNGFTGEQ
ncbi:hypothetical protein [Jeotgalicoccus marinus]|uniref:hypothetical protein n=1 Tax=Jeotgalicoccus marinus TaxID=516700 RepID=UPI0004253720|nr:hypothetical protein [Jeotgalicoccus marinus]